MRKVSCLLICLAAVFFLFSFEVGAQSNLDQGKELFLEARESFYNSGSEEEASIERTLALLEESQKYFSQLYI